MDDALEEGELDDGTALGSCCTGLLSKGCLRADLHGCNRGKGFGDSDFLSDGVFLAGAWF